MRFLHVGMKVSDIHGSMALFGAAFGMEWDPVAQYELTDVTLNGHVEPSRTLVTHGLTLDGTEVEMVQVLEGRTADHLVLGDREGISHIAFAVDDLPVAVARAERAGLYRVSEWSSPAVDFAFLAGESLGGVLAQLVQFKRPRRAPET